VLRPLYDARPDPRITTSRLLPQILKLKEQGWSYSRIADKLGVRKKQVEHVMARHRKKARKQQAV
jgi:orotate phosphoribosyltransferase-like protein